MNDDEIRWRQDFDSYYKSYTELEKYKDRIFQNDLEKAGYIHYFEMAFDFAHKVMFSYLDAKGETEKDYRQAVKKLEARNLIQNHRNWLKANNRSNLTLFLHQNEKLFDTLIDEIKSTYLPELAFFTEKLEEIK